MHKTLYEIISELCSEKGISVYKMCVDNKIPDSTIYTWKSRPGGSASLEVALRLAEYFGVPVETFLLKKGDQHEVSKTNYATI